MTRPYAGRTRRSAHGASVVKSFSQPDNGERQVVDAADAADDQS